MIVAFDVDGTLIDYEDNPRHTIIDLLKRHSEQGDYVIVWSGGGKEYAQRWVTRLGLDEYVNKVLPKSWPVHPDLTYDDQIVKLGIKNICVGTGDHEERW